MGNDRLMIEMRLSLSSLPYDKHGMADFNPAGVGNWFPFVHQVEPAGKQA